jgi:hypothetical protein
VIEETEYPPELILLDLDVPFRACLLEDKGHAIADHFWSGRWPILMRARLSACQEADRNEATSEVEFGRCTGPVLRFCEHFLTGSAALRMYQSHRCFRDCPEALPVFQNDPDR